MRDHWSVPFAVGLVLAAVVIAVAKLADWSNGELGVAIVAVSVITALVRTSLHDYSADRPE